MEVEKDPGLKVPSRLSQGPDPECGHPAYLRAKTIHKSEDPRTGESH